MCVAQVSTDTCICCVMFIWVSGQIKDGVWRDSRGSIQQGNASIIFMTPKNLEGSVSSRRPPFTSLQKVHTTEPQ